MSKVYIKENNKILKYIMAMILVIYPLRNAFTGLDLMDAGYALSNYRFFDVMNEMWRLATFLANVTGVALSKLPYGGTWIGMNIYTGFIIGATAASVFLFFAKSADLKMTSAFFISELAALSLCWSPSVILYHYLGYILMTITVMILYTAVTKDNIRYFMISGILLGLCVAVRMPNITYMAFILPFWYYCFLNKTKFKVLINRTLICIGGYAIGLIVPIAYICIKYGWSAYPKMIKSLFGMTDNATDYKPTSMITAMLGDYISYSAWLILFVAYGIVGIMVFKITKVILKENNKKIFNIIKILYIVGIFVLVRFCYGRGMFDFDYTAYFSMYKWAAVYLLFTICICIYIIAVPNNGINNIKQLKLWAVFLLVIIFITPLGSNNGLYPVINNLFITAPVSVYMLFEIFKALNDKYYNDKERFFVYKAICLLIISGITIQGILFGLGFIFHDAKARVSDSAVLELRCSSAADGIRTASEKKADIEELDSFIYDNDLNEKKVILYGDIPAVSYILDMEPAIFSTWADLDSNSMEILKAELEEMTEEPVIIFGVSSVERLEGVNSYSAKKLELINKFINDNGYKKAFSNKTYIIYTK